ncbi:hypothetical protein [Aetokthonos hydrillicola]|jgi:hypothetical protein|nr:hypothetical protein [Aetokthonos hydrillicola]
MARLLGLNVVDDAFIHLKRANGCAFGRRLNDKKSQEKPKNTAY